jgi:hypothetical protein
LPLVSVPPFPPSASIGGGGGGFNNETVSSGIKQAGDGSFSQFLRVRAEGGKGGTETNGKN